MKLRDLRDLPSGSNTPRGRRILRIIVIPLLFPAFPLKTGADGDFTQLQLLPPHLMTATLPAGLKDSFYHHQFIISSFRHFIISSLGSQDGANIFIVGIFGLKVSFSIIATLEQNWKTGPNK